MSGSRSTPRQKTEAELAAEYQWWARATEDVDRLRSDIAAALPRESEFVHRRTLYELLLAAWLGEDWVARNVERPTSGALMERGSNGASYFRRDREWGLRTAAMQYHRAGQLARRLFEFAQEDFYELLCSNLLHRDLEGAAFEADVIRMLMALPAHIDLRKEVGIKGDDYDIDLWFGANSPWPIEVKTRAEESAYSKRALAPLIHGV